VEHDFMAVPPYGRGPAFVAFDLPHVGTVLGTPERAVLAIYACRTTVMLSRDISIVLEVYYTRIVVVCQHSAAQDWRR
jgi:hypothetical protein